MDCPVDVASIIWSSSCTVNAATTVSSLLSKFAAATPWPPRPETRYSCAEDLLPNPPEVIISIQSSSSDNSS